ncbi:DUF6624 domain-containing protein [Dyadobacter sp. MSC1_007]|jgi:hypothetical protein|uniref:DUF6624 domain-containing protein n=1 Tax=Dyadobacter sp. MSC1_007 TaxID=2909264 RepID=UPI002030727D|nr:DUF6624 domain-containing protein [Dyadobacter sp. MSC1_007]
MKHFLKVAFCLFPLISLGQVNLSLKRELDSMYVLDQRYREYLSKISTSPALADSLKKALSISENLTGNLWTYQNRIDSSNLVRLEQIIGQVGYPGTALVGKPTDEAAFYIIQHSPKIGSYFPLVRQAAEANQVPFYLSAMMEDRLLTQQSKPQIYGSQVMCYRLITDKSKMECFVWPVKDAASVNERRSKAGFTQSIEANAQRLGVEYKPLTMEEVQKKYALK